MGCTVSSYSHILTSKAINSEFRSTYISNFDDYYLRASNLLKDAEKIRSALQDSREIGADISGTWRLVNCRYIDTIRVMLWSLSASAKGDIRSMGLKIMKGPPFLDVSKADLLPETGILYDTFFDFTRILINGPELLRNIAANLVKMNEMTPEMIKDAENKIKNENLTTHASMMAVGALSTNAKKFPGEMEKVKQLGVLVN